MRIRSLLGVVAIVLGMGASAFAKSPVRMTPDGTAILVNKDVNGARWAIALDLERASLTGNVFIGDTEEKFFWCGIIDSTGDQSSLATQVLTMHCFTADPCAEVAVCHAGFDEWHSIGEVQLPGTFFLP